MSENFTFIKKINKTFSCEAFGDPLPVVEWSSNHSLLNAEISIETHNDYTITSSLTIELTESARFTCTAQNSQSIEEKTIEATEQSL